MPRSADNASERRRRRTVFGLPLPVFALLVIVEAAAVGVVVVGFLGHRELPTTRDLVVLATLLVAAAAHTEAALSVERRRRPHDSSPHLDLSSVWTFAAALLLPLPLATVVAVLAYLHLYVRVWRHSGIPTHRFVFSLATVVLAVHVAGTIAMTDGIDPFGSLAGLGLTLAALVAYALVNLLLVATAILLSGGGPAAAFGNREELLLELATLATGSVAAGAIATFGPAYAVLVLPPLVVLHRSVLVRQLEEAASTDGKTGLLNAATWRLQAEAAVRATQRGNGAVAVLLLDLDHFKRINDLFGHLAGDQALGAVAAALRAEVRDEDLVGRFGGEEFVVLLAGAPGEDLRSSAALVADRIRRRIEGLRPRIAVLDGAPERGSTVLDSLTVSVGGATLDGGGGDLDLLLETADSALYAAKRAGRNTVRMGGGERDDPVSATPDPHGS